MDVGDGHCLGGGGTARASVRRVDALFCRVREDVDKVEPLGNAQRHERRRRGAANDVEKFCLSTESWMELMVSNTRPHGLVSNTRPHGSQYPTPSPMPSASSPA